MLLLATFVNSLKSITILDTVGHNILLERLENMVGISGDALKWFTS